MEKLSLRDRFIASLVGFIGSSLIKIIGPTLRVEWIGSENIAKAGEGGKKKIFVFWHGELLTLSYTHRNRGICVLVSRHRDGELIARALQRLGFATARGSSSRGGREGLFEMCKRVKDGWDLAITPDGPRGPRHKAQAGVLYVAQRTGVRILPLACVIANPIVLKSWDRFQIPLPFSRVIVAHGTPVDVPRDLTGSTLEEYRRILEKALARTGNYALARINSGRRKPN